MGTIYHFNQLTKLEFQLDYNDVLLSLEMTQNNVKNETSFLISHSEMNKIMGSIQFLNPEIDLFSHIETHYLNEQTSIYSVDLKKTELNNSWINEYQFQDLHKEIRA